MIAPDYGRQTICRPLFKNVVEAIDPEAELVACPYCGAMCWAGALELRAGQAFAALGLTFTSACTECAWKRAANQVVMDRQRWERENAEAAELAAPG
jgi:hypothetical protein